MYCFLCYCFNDEMQMFQGDMDVFEKIMVVLPDIAISESKDPVLFCDTCLEHISFFYTIKKASLQNCSRLKYFNAMLKGTNNFKSNELRVIINSDNVSAQRKHHIQVNVNSKNKYLLSSDERDTKHIKEEDNEDDNCRQQLVNVEAGLNHLQDEDPSCSSDDSTQHHVNVGSFEFVDASNFTEKDFYLTSNNSRHEDQPKIQHESQRKRFECTDCHKAFAYRSKLERHSRVHTGVKPYKCTTCQKTFTQSSILNSHKLTHTDEKPHKCDVCHKTFSQKCYLTRHKGIHNNVRPHQCSTCSKAFIKSGDLKRHRLTHTGEKPHQCHLCEYKCTRADGLKTHIRSHTGEKPYSCKHCDRSFTSTIHLKRHKHRLHSKEESN